MHESFKDLTGGLADELKTESLQWSTLLTYHRQGYLLGCGNPKAGSGHFTEVQGIVQGHAYSILQVREVQGHRLLQLRNPWGDTEWTGDWSKGSPQMTVQMQTLLGSVGSNDRNSAAAQRQRQAEEAQRGEFWMSLNDFLYAFRRVYLCRVFTDVVKISSALDPTLVASFSSSSVAQASDLELSRSQLHVTVEATGSVSGSRPGELKKIASSSRRNKCLPKPWFHFECKSAWRGQEAQGAPSAAFLKQGSRPELNPQWELKCRRKEGASVYVLLNLTQPTQVVIFLYSSFSFS